MSVHTASFPEADIRDVVRYMARLQQLQGVRVDCVYKEEGRCEILYVAARYLRRLSKAQARETRRGLRLRAAASEEVAKDQELLRLSCRRGGASWALGSGLLPPPASLPCLDVPAGSGDPPTPRAPTP